ncbi:NAD(P)-dependent alcohol dehydrogenase [Flagellimonas sp. DF-77]|uniref:NAD(P)-dependent alcohol dehydrogenase n=1 Tax=Flagellimonas algarum TaxID=3230298 RepID=UPI0033923E7B
MKAARYTSYGAPEVVKITDMDKPRPKPDEVLVKVLATTVTSGDCRLRASDFPPLFWLPARLLFGLFKPKKQILGHEFVGRIEAIGNRVTSIRTGDHVLGTTTMLPTGAHAEYVCVPQTWKHGVLEVIPAAMAQKEIAALPIGAMTAFFLLDKAGLAKDQNLLVYGASGSVGSYAVQLGKNSGAKVTAVCSRPNFDMVKSLGADHVIDYTETKYHKGETAYDVIFDAVGKTSKKLAKKVLRPEGNFVSVNMITQEKSAQLKTVIALYQSGKLTSYIDREFDLNDIVKAHHYVDSGRKKGNILVTFS